MKKLSILAQWLVLLTALGFLAAYLTRPVPDPLYEPETWGDWRGFHVLAYEGITASDNPRHVSPALLAEHLHALREDGWLTITAGDVFRFYAEGAPLPEKALLLLFEGARKDHLVRATPLLRDTGFIAHLAVPGAVTRQWGNHYLKSNEIQKMSTLPHWRFLSMGQNAIHPVPLDASGAPGNFLSQRAWTRSGPETDEQLRARIAADFRDASLHLSRWTGDYPAAYLFPYADAGESANADPIAAGIVHEELSRWHTLAFLREGDSFNSSRSDPFRLTRLRVRGDWSAAELLERMNAFAPPILPFVASDPEFDLPAGGTRSLPAARHSADLRFTLHLPADTTRHLEIHLRHNGPDTHLRLSLTDGHLLLHEKNNGPMVPLARADLPPGAFTLELLLKNNRLRIDANGMPLLRPVPVQVRDPGHVLLINAGDTPQKGTWTLRIPEPVYHWTADPRDALADSLDDARGVFFPLPGFPLEARLADWVQPAARGLHAIPVLSAANAEQAAEILENVLQARRGHPALATLLTRIAIPAEFAELRQSALDSGLTVYTLITTSDPVPRLGSREVLVFRTSENPGWRLHPPENILLEAPARDPAWPFELTRLHSPPEGTP